MELAATKEVDGNEKSSPDIGIGRPRASEFTLSTLVIRQISRHSGAAGCAGGALKLFPWRVSGGGGRLFLLGSSPFGSADFYPLPQEIEQLFELSGFLVEVADRSKVDAVPVRQPIVAGAPYAGADRLEDQNIGQVEHGARQSAGSNFLLLELWW
jgi:uncharacterized protein YbaP (TraB family)